MNTKKLLNCQIATLIKSNKNMVTRFSKQPLKAVKLPLGRSRRQKLVVLYKLN